MTSGDDMYMWVVGLLCYFMRDPTEPWRDLYQHLGLHFASVAYRLRTRANTYDIFNSPLSLVGINGTRNGTKDRPKKLGFKSLKIASQFR